MSRNYIAPGSIAELRVLARLVRYRNGADDDLGAILDLLERNMAMNAIGDAFSEIIDDETSLLDPDQRGNFGSAVAVSLDRDQFAQLSINVKLKQIEGAQLAFVLGVARRHELEVREEDGWLRLSPQLIATDDETADETAEASA